MSNGGDRERLLAAIKDHGESLSKRIGWMQSVIGNQEAIIERCQETIQHFQADLVAANIAVEKLRSEYRELLAAKGTT